MLQSVAMHALRLRLAYADVQQVTETPSGSLDTELMRANACSERVNALDRPNRLTRSFGSDTYPIHTGRSSAHQAPLAALLKNVNLCISCLGFLFFPTVYSPAAPKTKS